MILGRVNDSSASSESISAGSRSDSRSDSRSKSVPADRKPKARPNVLSGLLPGLLPDLPALPDQSGLPIEPFPGRMEGAIFVRRTSPAIESSSGVATGTAANPTGPPGTSGSGTQRRAVFVHGMGGSSTNWTDLMYLLAPTMAGVALDLPGYGFSQPSADGKYTINRYANAVIDVIEAEEAGPVHLFGNSLGGATAVTVAAARPDLVATLTLISPALLTRTVMAKYHLPKVIDVVAGVRAARKLTASEFARRRTLAVFKLCYSDAGRVQPQRVQAAIVETERRSRLPHNQTIALATARALLESAAPNGPASIWEKARAVSAPTLGIYGTADQLVPVELAPRAAEAFRRGRIVILPDCGHVAQMEHPQLTAQTVLQWMAQVGDSAGDALA